MKIASIAIITVIVSLCVLDATAFFGGSAWRRHYRRVQRERRVTSVVVPIGDICDATCKCTQCVCNPCSCLGIVK
jgi:hypothetical protein